MGLTYRKSLSAGPFRFNLSGSGIGVSVGIPGFRIGTGPQGNYVSVSAGGFTYRSSLPHLRSGYRPSSQSGHAGNGQGVPQAAPAGHTAPTYQVASASAMQLAASSSDAIVDEINEKNSKLAVWPFAAALAAVAVVVATAISGDGTAQSLASGALAVVACVAAAWGYLWDTARRTTVLFYQLNPASEQAFLSLVNNISQLNTSAGKWRIVARSNAHDAKYHAGASDLVSRSTLKIGVGPLPKVKCNVDIPFIASGPNTFHFCPDRVLVATGKHYAAVRYRDLQISSAVTQFVEGDALPADATVIGHTWQYVNKSGGPDRRFKNNRQLPVTQYEALSLTTRTGLNEYFHFSRLGLLPSLAKATLQLAALTR